ncbi:MAG: hypothetical protein K8T26_07415 [Lentisphaerae bacterium]|nr:hypothetical protein [Lentisphaerota bacterium]
MKCHLSLWFAAGLALMGSLAHGQPLPAVESPAPVYVIPVHDMIERGLLYAFRRGLAEAEANHARAIILDMDTPGGRLDAAEQMVLLLLNAKTRTYTFVNPRSISAGAIIAMATDEIYMTPVGLIGDAMPIMMSPIPFGGAQGVPEDLKEKVMSPTIALVRSAAQAKGHDPELGEAMIRPEAGYTLGEHIICPTGQLLTLTAQDASALWRDGGRPVLSSGTVTNLAQLLDAIGCADSPVVTVSITTAERIARVIEGFPVSGILLALGLLGLYIEFKTPGVGVPGIAGLVFLAIWFWGHHIAGLSGFFELLLFSAGVALLLVELFLIPGFGVTGTTGVLMMVAAILLSMVHIEPRQPSDLPDVPLTFPTIMWQDGILNFGVALMLVFGAGVVLARYLPKTSIFNRIALTAAVSSTAGFQVAEAPPTLVGRRGVATTPLRPAGIGEFDGERLSVIARGAYIDSGRPIVVAEARGNRIVVDAGTPPDQQA